MPRSIPEWIGTTDDAMPPQNVKLRILKRDHYRCRICGQKICDGDGTDFHHDPPLADGGENRESRIFPVHRKCHRMRTAQEALQRAEARGSKARAFGIKQSHNPLPGSRRSGWKHKMSGEWVRRETAE